MKPFATRVQGKGQWLGRALLAGVWLLQFLLSPEGFALDPSKQISQYNCQTWTRQNGLPVNGISAIAQTKDGYLWLGTSAGLVRFDGIDFDLSDLKQVAQIHSPRVRSLSASGQGGLWLGLNLSAFAYCDGKEVSFRGKNEWGGVSQNVLSILETRNGDLWLACQTRACRLTRAGVFETLLPAAGDDQSYEVNAVCEDSQGRVWLGTSAKGLFCWHQGVITKSPNPAFDEMNIRSLIEDQQGRIWVGSQSGLFGYDPDFQKPPLRISQTEPFALLVDRRGVLWAGLSGDGLLRYWNGRVTYLRKSDGLADDFVTALAEDREGSLWIGTRSGLSQLSEIKLPTFGQAEGLPGEVQVSVSASPKGGLWVATGSGFFRFDGGTNIQSYSAAMGLKNAYITLVREAKDGNLYVINGAREIEVFSGGKIVASYPNKEWPTALAEDAQGVVAAAGGELYRVGTNSFVPYAYADGGKLPLGYVYNMASGMDGSLWIASTSGLFQVKDGIARHWTVENGVGDTGLLWVDQDEHGVVWAGTTAGIARFKNGQLRCISRKDGLFDDIIYAMILDNGCFWAHSDSGFFRVSRQSLDDFADGKTKRVECTGFNDLNAVKSADRNQQYPSGCKTLDGRIWFPTARGLVMIDPAHIPTNEIAPPVHIDHVRANGSEFARNEVRSVPPGKGELEFHFTGLSFIAPRKVLFRYQLEGYDKEWVEAGNRRMAFYTNLKPGQYKFRVIAANADGIWNGTGDSLDIELRPHFYQTFWCDLLWGGLAMAVFAGFFAWRVSYLSRKQQVLQEAHNLLEQSVKERTIELAYEHDLLRSLLDNASDLIYFKDANSRFVRCSKSLCERSGTTPEEIVGKSDLDLYLEEHARPAFEDEQEVIRTGKPLVGRLEREDHPDGRTTWALTTKMPWRDAEGKTIGTFGISKDVTEIKRAEEELRRKTALFEALLNASLDGIMVVNDQGLTLVQNQQLGRLLKIPAGIAALAGDSARFQVVAEATKHPEAFREKIHYLLSHPGETSRDEVEFQDGTVMDTYSSAVLDEHGTYYGRIWAFRDITEQKCLQQEMERTHKQLMTASREAGMAEVATSVLHNVGNVLNSLTVSTTMILGGIKNSKIENVTRLARLFEKHAHDIAAYITTDPKGKEAPAYLSRLAQYLEEERRILLQETESVRQNVEHIREIVAMQQSYAKLSGVVELVKVPELIEDALRMNAGELAQHQVRVVRAHDSSTPEIAVDRHKVLQILVNLIRNARYACDESNRKDKELTLCLTHGEHRVRIGVQDNGVGIPAENLTRIFNYGFTTRKGGHGFGLHSAAIAAHEMGGQLTAQSEGPQRGAIFTLELPLQPPKDSR